MIYDSILDTIGRTLIVRINRLAAMLPDTAERYLTTALFEGINDASDAEPL